MSEEGLLLILAIVLVVGIIGAGIGGSIHSANVRQECVTANMQRSAGDVITICGKP